MKIRNVAAMLVLAVAGVVAAIATVPASAAKPGGTTIPAQTVTITKIPCSQAPPWAICK